MQLLVRPVLFPVVAVLATVALFATGMQSVDPASATTFVGGEIAKPSVEPLTSPDAVSARIQALATGSRVQVLSETTETSQTWVNPDGTFTTSSTGGPARIADESAPNGWRELDFTLVERSDGTVGPISGYTEVSLSGKATAAQVAKNGVARLEGQTGSDIVVGWNGALPKPSLDAQTATYKNVLPNIDLVITVTPTGIEQFYVVKAKPKKGFDLDLPIRMDGLATSKVVDGTILLKDKKNKDKVAGSIPTAYMWDARVDPASGTPAKITEVGMTADTDSLTLVPTTGFFDDPKIKYPVTIDPSINSISPSYDTTVRSDGGNTNYNVSFYPTELQVGTYNNGTSIARSYLNFPTTGWAGKKITAATLGLYEFHSYSCSASTMYVHAANSAATSTTTWNTQPGLSSTYNYEAFAKGYNSGCAAGWVYPNALAAVDYWAAGGGTTAAIAIAGSDAGTLSWKRFYSQDAPSGYRPVLNVTYNSYPSIPTPITVAPAATANAMLFTSSTLPTFTAKSTDPDGSNTTLTFEVRLTAGPGTLKASCVTPAVPSGTDASCTVTKALVDGTTYFVKATASDGSLNSASSVPMQFIVSTSPPPAPSITCPTPYTNGSWASALPPSAVTCSIVASLTPYANSPVSVSVQIDGGTPTSALAGTVSAIVPATSGPHTIKATTVSGAGLQTVASYTFGYGTAGISAPTETSTTIDTVRLSAAAPPRGSSTVTAVLKWRPANAASTTWNTVPGSVTLNSGSGTTPVTVDNFMWSTKSATIDTSTGTSVTLNPRLPVLLELQICFTYAPGGTKCTSDGVAPTQVLRVPHAFGDGFPVATAGDGQVALWTGELNLGSTDVSVSTLGGGLAVSRSHSTFAGPQDAVTSAFGPGWSASFEGEAGATALQVVDGTTVDGTISLVDGDGSALVFRHQANGTASAPEGSYLPVDSATSTSNAQLAVAGTGSSRELLLTTVSGTKTLWRPQSGSTTPIVWLPVSVTEAGGLGTTAYSTNATGQVTRILAPVPEAVNCNGVLVAGCSALHIAYGTSTTATSTTPGNFLRQVSGIEFETFDPTTASMVRTLMVSYKYDSSGRLVSFKNEQLGTTVSYSYATYAGNLALAEIDRSGYAATYFAYDTTAGLKLKNVSLGGATSGAPTSIQSAFVYSVPVSTVGLPDVSATVVAKWGQTRVATAAYAVFGPQHPVTSSSAAGISASDWAFAQLSFTDAEGYAVNRANYGAGQWLVSADIYDTEGLFVASLDASDVNAAVAAAAASQPFVPADHEEFVRYGAEVPSADPTKPLVSANTLIVDRWSAPSSAVLADGSVAWVRTHSHYSYDQGAPHALNPATGKPYLLLTGITTGVTTTANYSTDPTASLAADLETISVTQFGYDPIDGASPDGPTSGWVLGSRTSTTTVMPNALDNITHKVRFDASGAVVESREPSSTGADAGTTRTIRYTATANTEDPACGNKPAWAGLNCWSGPAAAPETGVDLPDQRVTGYTMWLSPGEVVETSGAGGGTATRTSSAAYFADGRARSTTVATTGLSGSLSVATSEILYDSLTKAQIGVATVNATGDVISSVGWTTDLWGRTVGYTNSFGELTTTTYVGPGNDGAGQVASVTDPTGVSAYVYDGTDADGKTEHRGLPTALSLSSVGSFAAAYDAHGLVVKEVMPGGIRQDIVYAEDGSLNSLTYVGAAGGSTASWLSFSRDYDVAGRVAHEWTPTGGTVAVPNGSASSYKYDRAGRLLMAQTATFSPSGDACAVRQYVFDKQGNRTSRSSASSLGLCPTSGFGTETWAFDAYSRQISGANGSGTYAYDAFGRQTTMPAVDAPHPANGDVTIGYYDTDAVASIAQGGTTETFVLDPVGRRATQQTTSGSVNVTSSKHYGDTSDNPSWATSIEGGASATTRFLSSLGGGMSVTSTSEGPVTTNALMIADPSGNVVTTVIIPASGVATGVTGYSSSDEYGADATQPNSGVIAYGWLGSDERAITDTGLVLMGVRVYNPETGRFTSQDVVVGGNENAYAYPNDPVNDRDATGMWSYTRNFLIAVRNVTRISSIVAYIYSHFSKVFPIKGAPTTLKMGARFVLWVRGVVPFPLVVDRANADGWRFSTTWGHPDHPGNIGFRIWRNSKNSLYVEVHGVVGDGSAVSSGINAACARASSRGIQKACISKLQTAYADQAAYEWTLLAHNIGIVVGKV